MIKQKNIFIRLFENKMLIFGLIMLFTFLVIHFNNDYLDSRDRKCVVIDKIKEGGTYKHHGNLYLILKTENHTFDLIVTPVTYSQAKIGNTLTFNLRNMDIKQSIYNNIVYFFLYIFSGVCGFVFTIKVYIIKILNEKKYSLNEKN